MCARLSSPRVPNEVAEMVIGHEPATLKTRRMAFRPCHRWPDNGLTGATGYQSPNLLAAGTSFVMNDDNPLWRRMYP